jgi:hypothetical protein
MDYLHAFDKQTECENCEAGKGKPERVTGKSADNANGTEKTEQTKNYAEPERHCFRGCKFHSNLLELNVITDWGGSMGYL